MTGPVIPTQARSINSGFPLSELLGRADHPWSAERSSRDARPYPRQVEAVSGKRLGDAAEEDLEGLLDFDGGGFGFRAFLRGQFVEGFLDVLLEVLLGDPGEAEREPGSALDSVCVDSHA